MTTISPDKQKIEARKRLEEQFGQVWNTKEATRDFEFSSFAAPFVFVTRKSDGKAGALTFEHDPRFYFDFR